MNTQFGIYGMRTFATALGVAGGMSIGWTLCDLSRRIAGRRERFHQEQQS